MKLLKIIFHIDNLITTVIVILVMQYFTIYQNLDFLNPFINLAQDLNITDVVFSKIRNDGRYGIDSNIVIVNIGELNRRGIAEEIKIINKYKPLILGVDVLFAKKKTPDVDIPLKEAFEKTRNLVLPTKLKYDYKNEKFDTIIYCNEQFIKNSINGFVNVIASESYKNLTKQQVQSMLNKYARTVRKVSTREYVNGVPQYSFPAQILKIYSPEKFKRLMKRNKSEEIIDYSRNIDKYITIDVNEIFHHSPKLKLMKNKIVLLGYLGPDIHTLINSDIFFTPLNPHFIGKSLPDMYGVVIHANVLSMMLRESYFYTLPKSINDLIKYLLVYFMMAGLLLLRYKFNMLYEPLSITLLFGNLFFWFFFIIYLFNVFYFFIDLKFFFLYIFLTVPVFELYQDSFKPMSIKIFKRFWSLMGKYFNFQSSDRGNK